MPGPLDGVLVVDLTRALAGPHAAMMLGDLGARGIKVENPGSGDDTRGWGPPFLQDGSTRPDAAYYLCANRNKRSVAVDFARPEGAALVRRLAADADVLVENFRTGVLERLGLVWHTHLGKGAPVYHAAAEHPHLHVVCASCGQISSADPALLDGAAERLAADLGFQLDVGHVALSGTCRECRERAGTEHA